MIEEAIGEFQKAIDLSGGSPFTLAGLGHAYAIGGQRGEPHKVLETLKESAKRRYVSPHSIAVIHADLGETDQAFARLEKAFEERAGWLVWLKAEPISDPLRSDPRSPTCCAASASHPKP